MMLRYRREKLPPPRAAARAHLSASTAPAAVASTAAAGLLRELPAWCCPCAAVGSAGRLRFSDMARKGGVAVGSCGKLVCDGIAQALSSAG